MNGRIEIREGAGDGKLTLEGYASRTETPYEYGTYVETVQRGAFKRSLKEGPDTTLLVNHAGLPIARTSSGTLTLSEDENGLRVRAELEPEDPDVQAIAYKMRRGDLSEMSMGFRVTDQDWNDDYSKRTITAVSLHRGDVSVVSAAASPTSTATLRSVEATLEQRKRLAERIGDRLCGPMGFELGADGSTPAVLGRSQIAVPRSVTRRSQIELAKSRRAKGRSGASSRSSAARSVTRYSHLEIAKAYTAKGGRAHPGSDASVEGEEDTPRYTPEQITKLGEEGKAFKKKNGTYGWPIADGRDVSNAVKDFMRAKAPEPGVRAWIVKRARVLNVEHRLPASWVPAAPVGASA